jgi:hypothetical protein
MMVKLPRAAFVPNTNVVLDNPCRAQLKVRGIRSCYRIATLADRAHRDKGLVHKQMSFFCDLRRRPTLGEQRIPTKPGT